MKHFNIYCLLVLALGLLMIGCKGDNYDMTETETTDSEPTELESASITGKVSNSSGLPIASAEISILQEGKELLVTTDASGFYTLELPDLSDKMYLQAAASSYITSGISSLDLNETLVTKDFTLLKQDELLYSGNVQALSGGALATIKGQVLLADGRPAANFSVLLFDFSSISSSSFVFTYALTDEDGNYCITHEPFENHILLVHDACITETNFDIIEEDLSLGDSDLDLGVHQSTLGDLGDVTLSGFITDCNTNEGLDKGVITATIGSSRVSADIVDGVYSLEFSNCKELSCVPVTITSTGEFVGYSSFDCFDIPSASNTLDHSLCGDDRIQEGEIRLLVGSDSIIYEKAFIGPPMDGSNGYSISYLDFNNLSDYLLIRQEGTELGTYDVTELTLAQNLTVLYTATGSVGNSLVQVTIDEIDQRMVGTISGLVVDASGELVPLSGTYNIEI